MLSLKGLSDTAVFAVKIAYKTMKKNTEKKISIFNTIACGIFIFAAAMFLMCSCVAQNDSQTSLNDLPAENVSTEAAGISDVPQKTDSNKDVADDVETTAGSISTASTVDSDSSENSAYKCTVSVKCETLLEHKDELTDGVTEILPSDGIIISETEVAFEEGDSVFDVLFDITQEKEIHMEFVNTPLYGSAYIKGIANIYEFDCGSLSGWMYSVNGMFPNTGCSSVFVKNGDEIEWLYSCDLGKDIGNIN